MNGPDAGTTECIHCGLPLPPEDSAHVREGFCCRGCKTVHGLLEAGGLEKYYELRDGPGMPIGDGNAKVDRHWIEPLRDALGEQPDGARLDLDIQGIHCAGCVWVIERVFERQAKQAGGGFLQLNPTLGRAEIQVDENFDLEQFVDEVEALGYRLGPAGEEDTSATDALLIRTGICMALAGNSMLFAASVYFGLREGPIYDLLNQMSYAAAALAVFIGGSVFIKAAWQGLRRGLIHLDLPIAIGIILAFAGSSYTYFLGSGEAEYLDTVTIFIALMLLGRYVQERVLEKNRRRLLRDDGVEGMQARRVEGDQVKLVRSVDIEEGDILFLGSGDLVPVDAVLIEAPRAPAVDAEGNATTPAEPGAEFSLDWIDGESRPRRFALGKLVPGGAFHVGSRPVRVRAATDFSSSPVTRLLRSMRRVDDEPVDWWQRISTAYVFGVFFAGITGFAYWTWAVDLLTGLEVATAVLVVTCPCAFGIATPLAYELVQSRLRRRGLFVRTRGFLDRLRTLERVVFDKTGTLTTGKLSLVHDEALAKLDPRTLEIVAALATASSHPKSQAVAAAIEDLEVKIPALPVEDHPGRGVGLVHEGLRHRLGAPRWAVAKTEHVEGVGAADVVYSVEGVPRLALETRERLRPDAVREVEALARRFEIFVLSGDAPERVLGITKELGLDADHALGGRDPEAKAAWLEEHDPTKTLMIGDGLNDSLAATTAAASGTPAIDRPFLASRCDFYFTTPGLAPIRESFEVADALRASLRVVLGFAVLYNVGAVVIAWAGFMQPWLAAVLMPSSSLASITYVLASLGPTGFAYDAAARRGTGSAGSRGEGLDALAR